MNPEGGAYGPLGGEGGDYLEYAGGSHTYFQPQQPQMLFSTERFA